MWHYRIRHKSFCLCPFRLLDIFQPVERFVNTVFLTWAVHKMLSGAGRECRWAPADQPSSHWCRPSTPPRLPPHCARLRSARLSSGWPCPLAPDPAFPSPAQSLWIYPSEAEGKRLFCFKKKSQTTQNLYVIKWLTSLHLKSLKMKSVRMNKNFEAVAKKPPVWSNILHSLINSIFNLIFRFK